MRIRQHAAPECRHRFHRSRPEAQLRRVSLLPGDVRCTEIHEGGIKGVVPGGHRRGAGIIDKPLHLLDQGRKVEPRHSTALSHTAYARALTYHIAISMYVMPCT